MDSSGVYHLSVAPHTPAALQPYLEDENSRSGDDTVSAEEQDQASCPVDIPTEASQAEVEMCEQIPIGSPLQAPKPQSVVIHEALEVPFANKPLSSLAVQSGATSQPSRSPRPPSTARPAPGGPYLTSPQAFAPVVPYQGTFGGEQYYMQPYAGQHHYQMAPPNPREVDIRHYATQHLPYYPEHGPPYPYQAAFNSVSGPSHQTYGGNPGSVGTVPTARSVPRVIGDIEGQIHHERTMTGGPSVEDDGIDLLDRIQTAIPDLHLLMSRYRETADQLDAREALIRQTEAAKVEALQQKEAYISRLERELDSISHKYAAENDDLKREIEEREEERQELEADAVARQKSRDRLEAACHNLQKEKELIEKRSEQASELATQEYTEWKDKLMEEFATKKKQMNEELQQKIKHEVAMQNRMLEMNRSQTKERESLRAALEAARQELDWTQKKERENREAWKHERETMMQDWEEERKKFQRELEEQRRAVDARYAEDKEKLQKSSRRTSHVQLNMHPEVENAELRKEVERLRTLWNSDKSKLAKATGDIKEVTAKLHKIADECAEPGDFRG